MTKAQDLINYYKTPKFTIDPKFESFFDEVYKLSSLEIHSKIHKLTKGFNRLDQLIGMYNLYNSYVHFKSNWEHSLKTMNEDEFTLFKRRNDIVKSNDLVFIDLQKNELVFESYESLKYSNIEVYKRQTFSDILEHLIKSEYAKVQPQQTIINTNNFLTFQQNDYNTIVQPQQSETKAPTDRPEKYDPKPRFKPEEIESVIELLNAYFDTLEYAELKRIIETGDKANEKLLFKDKGNKLTDCFRKLKENNTITGCSKKVLINWIVDNFRYTDGETQKDYNPKTVEKIISSKDRLCKNPII